jgi:hypothetical protein
MTGTIVNAQSGHTMFVEPITFGELPEVIKTNGYAPQYKKFYVVKNFDKDGVIFFYLAEEGHQSKKEIVCFYCNGEFWSSFGKTLKEAIDGAQKDGWMHTRKAQS